MACQHASFTSAVPRNPRNTHPIKLGLSRTLSLPQSPQTTQRSIASQDANLQNSQRSFSTLQSDLVGCQRQRVQPFSACDAPSDVQRVRAVIQNELDAFQKILIAKWEAAVKQFKAVTEACFQAEKERQKDLSKQHSDLEQNVFRLQEDLSRIDSHMSNVESQQMFAQSQHQVFENDAIKFFQSLDESLRALQHRLQLANILPDDAWSVVAEAEQACRSLDGGGSTVRGGQPVASSPSSSTRASFAATKKVAFRTTEPVSSEFENSSRIECLEVAVESMKQHEQEQIRRLQQRIRDRQEHATVAFPSAAPGKSPMEKGRVLRQDLIQHGTTWGA